MGKSLNRRTAASWVIAYILAAGLILSESLFGAGVVHAAPPPVPFENRPAIIAPRAAHDTPVSATPVSWTPRVLDGKIVDITQVGDLMVAGGNFSQVAPSSGSPTLNRSNVVAFSAANGAINTSFAPTVSGGVVNAVEAGPTPGTVYVGGSFQGVNGVTGKVVLLNVSTGQVVSSFTPPSMNGAVNDLQLVGDRLYVGGYFKRVASNDHGGLVALNATTGDREAFVQIDLTENHNYTGQPGQSRAGVGAKSIAVTPQGDVMAVVGNFRKTNGLERRQMVMIDLTGPAATVKEDWKTNRLAPSCFSFAFDTYVRDIDVSPDGTYFVLATTGGPNPGTLCDTVSRWDVEATGQDVQPKWLDETGGDTLLSATASGAAVYAGGHQRWMNNLGGRDRAAPGAVPRAGIGAVDAGNGIPISWNPGRNPRGVGAEALYVTEGGLWVGSDTEWIGNRSYRRPRLAYFPVAGGTPLGAGETGVLPSNVYKTGDVPIAPTGTPLYRINAGGPAVAALDGGPGWAADDGATSPYRNSGSNAATWASTGRSVDGTVPAVTPGAIFDAERWNPGGGETMQWAFPVPAGEDVVVRLYFANRYSGTSSPGQRVFDVRLEGQTVLGSYDIAADVGHNVGTVKTFTVTSDGVIDIEWLHGTENPLVNGIEILEAVDAPDPVEEPTGVSRVWFTGDAVDQPAAPAPAGDIEWSEVRGAVVIDGILHYGTVSGEFVRRTFDGETYGDPSEIDPYNDPYWSDIGTGGNGPTYRGIRPSFYGQLSSLTGMAYEDGRLYYTRVGSNRLFSRAFSPDSGVIGQTVTETPAFSTGPISGVFFDEDGAQLYFANAANGDLSRVEWDGSAAVGAPVVVSGPSIDGVDWRGRAVFLADGPRPVVNEPPVAMIDVECDRLECTFDGTTSTDPDGTIAGYEWDFGDGSAPSTDGTVTHVFDDPGTYTVTLTVTDDEGATGSTSVEHEVLANQPPVAVISDPVCEMLECAFDGSQSSDPDSGDSIVAFEWDFGDGSAAVPGETVTHTFGAAGTYPVKLTVTDEGGATGSSTHEVAVSESSSPVETAPELVGTVAASLWVADPAVSVPDDVEAGDLLVLFASTNQSDPYPDPAGWVLEQREVSGGLGVSVFSRVAEAGDAGSQVALALPSAFRSDLTLVAYRGVGESGVEGIEAVVARNTATHTSPQVTVSGENRVALTYWADRSSTTTQWTAPAGVEVLSTQVGTRSGRLGTLLAASLPDEGLFGELIATTDAPSSRSVSLTLTIAPVSSP